MLGSSDIPVEFEVFIVSLDTFRIAMTSGSVVAGTSLPTGVMSSLRGKSTSDREASEAKF